MSNFRSSQSQSQKEFRDLRRKKTYLFSGEYVRAQLDFSESTFTKCLSEDVVTDSISAAATASRISFVI